MNGFSSAILSLLLGWLRTLFDNLWRVLSSESGSSFLSFLRLHWKTVFVVLCVGGFVLDRVIYFFRWRPDYVWGTRWGRLKRRLSRGRPLPREVYAPTPQGQAPAMGAGRYPQGYGREAYGAPQEVYRAPYGAYEAPREVYGAPREAYAAPEVAYSQTAYDAPAPAAASGFAPLQSPPWPHDPVSSITRDFAPLAVQGPEVSYAAPPFADVQPVFDDPTEVWAPVVTPELPVDSYQQPYENPAQDLAPGFGISKPEPAVYLRETQESYAPPPVPEMPYPSREVPPENEPVHPGLDLETFQQNIGLGDPQDPAGEEEKPLLKPLVDFPDTSYVSYYREAEPEAPARPKGGLSSLAKKARELVRVSDENNPPTIRDLQPTANFKTAFHSPVLPKKPGEGGEE